MGRLTGQQVSYLLLIPAFMQTVYSIAPLTACPESNPDRYEQHGEIASPNYPNEYPPGAQCKWRIYHDPDEIVTISFKVFNVEETDGGTCSSDVLQIQEKVFTRSYCGYERPAPYISDPTSGSKDIIVRFESDQQVSGGGFLLEYYKSQQNVDSCPDQEVEFLCQNHKCILKDWLCNGMDECGDHSDEAFDLCQAASSVAPFSPVSGEPNCPSHTIYCLKNDGSPQCLPEDKKCDGNKDCLGNEDELGCQVTCVHEMPPPSGSFSSPNYPGKYQNNLDCRWTLVVHEGNIIQLRFVSFDIEYGYHRDYVTVYDGGSISADIIGTYYGYKSTSPETTTHYPPSVIEGTSNRLYVTFITDGSAANSGFNATYQSKGDCIDDQRTCSATDSNCYAENERCDGEMTCLRGEDEQGCNGCPEGEIPCSSDTPVRCYNSAERCNGQPHCSGKEDELDCPAVLCGGEHGLFLCGTGKCIKENWICDDNVDCEDHTDEMDCPMSPKVITASVVGSIVCGLLLVAALSCTCKLYQLYHSDPHPPTHSSPLSEIEDELMRREAPPSYTASMSSPHFDEAQRAFIESLQAAAQARSREGNRRSGRSRRNNSQPDSGDAPQNANRPSSPESANTTQDTVSTTDSTMNGREASEQNPPSSDAADDGSSPYTEITELRETPNLGADTASSCTTDTDSDTNAEAELEQRDQDIIRAATNIRRMRLAGGIQNIVDTVTNRQREGAANGDGETRRRSSSGLQNIIERVNRSRESQQRGEGGSSGPNSPTGVSPPVLAEQDGTRTPPNTQESSFTSEEDHSPEQDNAVNHQTTSSARGSDVVQEASSTAERNKSSGASEQEPSSNSPLTPPSPSPSSRSDDAPLDLSHSNALYDENSTLIDDDDTMLLAS